MNKQKRTFIHLLITILGLLLIFLLTPNNHLFGSSTDWFSQHVQIGDTLRTTIFEYGLFYDFVPILGGGQNIYAFSYYGLFRPDILISLLLPTIAMKDIIICYMIFNFIFSLNLLYYFLKKHKVTTIAALISVACFAFSSFIFHSHRQVMFVNYMPYLLLSMLYINQMFIKKNAFPFIISCILIILHSFFFAVSSFFVLGIYFLYTFRLHNLSFKKKEHRFFLWKFLICLLLATMFCAILLFPTTLILLAQPRNGKRLNSSILMPNVRYKNLFYDTYGAGLTLVAWIGLCLALRTKKNRSLSITLILCLSFPIISYLLNGTLYIRTKVFIPFLPLILLVVSETLSELVKKIPPRFHPTQLLILFPLLFSNNTTLLFIDLLLCALLWFFYRQTKKPMIFLFYILYPLVICMENNMKETYIKTESYQNAMYIEEDQRLKNYSFNHNYRFDDIRYTLTNVNYASVDTKRTTMYTSINNLQYNTFFYDIAYNAIPNRNRVITSLQNNYIFQEMMGVRYLYTNKKTTPYNYTSIYENGAIRLLENEHVLPIAYATSNIIGETSVNKLAYPDNLDALYRYTIVKDSSKNPSESKIRISTSNFHEVYKEDTLTYSILDNAIKIDSVENSELHLKTKQSNINKMLLIQFDVSNIDNIKNNDLSITINEIQNKLSSESAPYPNDNTTFTYILSSNEPIDTLTIIFSKGQYTLENISVYELPYTTQKRDTITPFDSVSSNSVLKGNIETKEDGYFITSLPIQDGYEVYVNGKKQVYETVNKSFLGFPLPKGNHDIEIKFTAPGKHIGVIISLSATILISIYVFVERKGYYENRN